ncbi:penicillin-insensitive murein endopeptidase [Roseococcus pinisoli]
MAETRLTFLRTLAGAMALFLAGPASAQGWSTVQAPSSGPARVIGTTGLGCIAGAVALPPEGAGYQVVRLSRNRNWGHPDLIRFIQSFAGRSGQDLWIGDLAQPRGGPMSSGHLSHQVGLDVDIWLDLRRKPASSRTARENIPETSLVLPDQSGVDPARFTEAHARLIRLAAETPGVDRVLVNHGIKRSLCAMHRGEAWLHRVRPWRGHDSHMHVRLRCPAGSSDCREGAAIPAGDGCDASLDWWMSEDARRPRLRPPGPPPPRPQLPAACAAVLRAP